MNIDFICDDVRHCSLIAAALPASIKLQVGSREDFLAGRGYDPSRVVLVDGAIVDADVRREIARRARNGESPIVLVRRAPARERSVPEGVAADIGLDDLATGRALFRLRRILIERFRERSVQCVTARVHGTGLPGQMVLLVVTSDPPLRSVRAVERRLGLGLKEVERAWGRVFRSPDDVSAADFIGMWLVLDVMLHRGWGEGWDHALKRFHSRDRRAKRVAEEVLGTSLAELWQGDFVAAILRSEDVLLRVFGVTDREFWDGGSAPRAAIRH